MIKRKSIQEAISELNADKEEMASKISQMVDKMEKKFNVDVECIFLTKNVPVGDKEDYMTPNKNVTIKVVF